MNRFRINPRLDWQKTVESQGLAYHTDPSGTPYWDESVYYEFTADEVDILEAATAELHARCMDAAKEVIENNRLGEIGIPPEAHDLIRWSWQEQEKSIYGRFDLAYDGKNPPKMLEYNADTPTTLVEGAIIQWYWKVDRFPSADQFNSMWESLVDGWRKMREAGTLRGSVLYATSGRATEDWMTVSMMRDTAEEAGVKTAGIYVDRIGWNPTHRIFLDEAEMPIQSVFKLYPWEWLLKDQFGQYALETYKSMQWIEPLWKFVLSCKGILPVLWDMFPGHANLVPAYADGPRDMSDYVVKPVIGREGANVTIHAGGDIISNPGRYGDYPMVYQQFCAIPSFEGNTPVLGSWIINGEPHGMGIRETDGLITTNLARFVPHIFT